jgi:hypothetical protein
VKFSIQLFNFLAGIHSFNFSYKSFAEDQKNNLKLACKADEYSLPVRGKKNNQRLKTGMQTNVAINKPSNTKQCSAN